MQAGRADCFRSQYTACLTERGHGVDMNPWIRSGVLDPTGLFSDNRLLEKLNCLKSGAPSRSPRRTNDDKRESPRLITRARTRRVRGNDTDVHPKAGGP